LLPVAGVSGGLIALP
jgi:hypothetical protein